MEEVTQLRSTRALFHVPVLPSPTRDLEGFTGQTPTPPNRPKIHLTTTTPQNEENKSIFVVYDLTLVILEVFRIVTAL